MGYRVFQISLGDLPKLLANGSAGRYIPPDAAVTAFSIGEDIENPSPMLHLQMRSGRFPEAAGSEQVVTLVAEDRRS